MDYVPVVKGVVRMEWLNGGESGIRTQSGPLASVSYRKQYAVAAKNAMFATPHCPPLPAGAGKAGQNS
jgi:hypothetical protein